MLQMPPREGTRSDGHQGVTLREITARLTGMTHSVLVGRLRPSELVRELRAVADWIDGGAKPEAPVKEEVTTQVEADLFAYWQRAFGKAKAKLTPERRRVLRARLREGYSPADIRRAIDGCKASEFHSGDNDRGTEYNDLTLICRNGTKLEAFRDRAKSAVTVVDERDAEAVPARVQSQLDELVRESGEALARGDINAYNRTEAEIQKLRAGSNDAVASRPRRAGASG